MFNKCGALLETLINEKKGHVLAISFHKAHACLKLNVLVTLEWES